MRPFTPDECEALVAAGIISEGDSISPRAFPDILMAVDEFMPPASEGRGAQ